MKRNIKGITLISLVVTIIVLLILSLVTLNLIIGNNGLFKRADDGAKIYNKEEAREAMNLKITNAQMASYIEKQELATLQYLADSLCEDEEIDYVVLESKKESRLGKIEVGEAKNIYTKIKQYPYEFEINSELQLTSIDGIKLANTPENDEDTIISMTKAELQELIKSEVAAQIENQTNKTTDWKDLELMNGCQVYYDPDGNEWRPKYKIINNVVYIRGAVTSIEKSGAYIKIPEEIMPKDDIECLCPSNSTYICRWKINAYEHKAVSLVKGTMVLSNRQNGGEAAYEKDAWYYINVCYPLN